MESRKRLPNLSSEEEASGEWTEFLRGGILSLTSHLKGLGTTKTNAPTLQEPRVLSWRVLGLFQPLPLPQL